MGTVFQYRYDDEILRVDPAGGTTGMCVVGRHNEVRAKRAMHAGVVTTQPPESTTVRTSVGTMRERERERKLFAVCHRSEWSWTS